MCLKVLRFCSRFVLGYMELIGMFLILVYFLVVIRILELVVRMGLRVLNILFSKRVFCC